MRDHHFSSQPARSTPEESLLISEKSTRILKALKFVKTLRLGVVKFVETARQSRVDGYIVEEYEPGGTSDRISLITVLAFMEERGLRFAEANSDPLGSRLQVFKEMRDYYGLLYGLSIAVQEQEQEVARIDLCGAAITSDGATGITVRHRRAVADKRAGIDHHLRLIFLPIWTGE